MTCPACGGVVFEGARFCPSCGHQLVSRGDERRVATVLFADLVGFTTLSETSDPEQVKYLVDGCFELLVQDITSFGGRIDKIIGDAILALFGAPVAHEDDADRAVRAALRMQQTLIDYAERTGAGIQVRIGVNTGEVLVGSLRAGGEYTAMGDVVNIAQRLQTAAEPGTVVVGPATHAATVDSIEYRALGSVSAKGREAPVEAFVAIEPLLPPGYRRRRVATPFVGRDTEMGMLQSAVRASVERRRALFLLLLGEAGVGKSRLAEEVAGHAMAEFEALVLEGRCVPYGEANVWWPVAEALRRAVGISADSAIEDAEKACLATVSEVLGHPQRSPEVKRIVNGLLYLMGYEVSLREIDPQRAHAEALRSVLAFIEAAARSRPVVVVLSDLHWADDLVLEMLGNMLDRFSRYPFVFIATARASVMDRWTCPSGRHNNVVVNLDPLDRESAATLLNSLFECEPDEATRETLLDRSGGNPFFLEELVAYVAADVDRRPDAPAATDLARPAQDDRGPLGSLPDTLRGIVAARIDALSPEQRATLEDAAVWGRSGPIEALQQMATAMHGVDDAMPSIGRLVDDEILVVYGDRWRFRNDVVREVAYGMLTKADRARRHCGIASFLQRTVVGDQGAPERGEDDEGQPLAGADDRLVDVIAHHFAAASVLVRDLGPIEGVPAGIDVEALQWLREAAQRAQIAQAMPVAARLYGQALELVEPDDDRLRMEVLLGRASAYAELRHAEEARADVTAAMELSKQLGPVEQARCMLVLGDIKQKGGDLEGALVTLLDAASSFRASGDLQGLADAERLVGMTLLFGGRLEEAEAAIADALDSTRQLADRRGEAWALQNLAWISYMKGHANDAEERIRESVDLFSDLGDSGGLNWALGLLGFVKFHQGSPREAGDLAEQVLVEARERGDRWGEGMMLLLLSGVRLWSGRAQSALVAAEDALSTFRSIGDPFGEGQALASAGRCMVAIGRVTEGLTSLHAALGADTGGPGGDEPGVPAAAGLAGAAVQVGAPYLAFEALESLTEVSLDEVDPARIGAREMLVARGLALLQMDDVDAALETLELARVPDADGTPSSYALSALAMACAAAGEAERAVELAEQVAVAPRTTYNDRTTATIAALLARASKGDHSVGDDFADLQAQIDLTDDRTARAIVALANAMASTTLVLPNAVEARARADTLLESLDLHAEGWRTIFDRVLGGVAVDAVT